MKEPIRVRAFTLIELLVVIAIIGVLSAVVLASLNTARARARYVATVQQLEQLARAAEMDQLSRGSYAPDVGRGVNPGFEGLATWPTPPCPGWLYDWDGPTHPYSNHAVKVMIGTSGGHLYRYYLAGQGTHADDIRNAVTKEITCNETPP